jgi:hypothetical protein
MSRFVTTLVCVVALGATAAATVFVPTEFREVVADAGLIVRGHLTDVRAIATGATVETVGTVAVENVLKGQSDGFVSIRVPGGVVDGRRFVMVGAPELRVGEQALFFLKRGADNVWRPVGLSMGICSVHADPVTGRPVIDPPVLAGRTATAGQRIARGDPRRRPMSIQEFESMVQLVVATRAGVTGSGR